MVSVPTRTYEPGFISDPPRSQAILDELRRISDQLIAYPEAKGILQGQATPLVVGTTRAIIQGWPSEYEGTSFGGKVDPTLGTITLPANGLYQIAAVVAGTHSSSTQNEAAALFLRSSVVGDRDLAVFGISTNKQTAASFTFTATGVGVQDEVLSLGLYATTAIGTFTFAHASFEATLRTLG